jgi:hypothetical protein
MTLPVSHPVLSPKPHMSTCLERIQMSASSTETVDQTTPPPQKGFFRPLHTLTANLHRSAIADTHINPELSEIKDLHLDISEPETTGLTDPGLGNGISPTISDISCPGEIELGPIKAAIPRAEGSQRTSTTTRSIFRRYRSINSRSIGSRPIKSRSASYPSTRTRPTQSRAT